MKTILFVLLTTALIIWAFEDVKAAEYTGEIALGVNVSPHMPWSIDGADGGFDGPIDTVRFSLRASYGNNTFLQYSHISHLSTGWPVNDEQEDWLDIIEFGVKFSLF